MSVTKLNLIGVINEYFIVAHLLYQHDVLSFQMTTFNFQLLPLSFITTILTLFLNILE